MSHKSAGTILVVGDPPTNLAGLMHGLTQAGFQVFLTNHEAETIATAHKTSPDLIVLDLPLPNLDGLELCHRLKVHETTRSIPIMVLSAIDDPSESVKGFQGGVADWICQPYQPEELLARVTSQVRLHQLTQQLQTQQAHLEQERQERQRLEAELQESEQIFRRLAENLQTVVWLANRDLSEIFYVNPAYETIWGHSCERLKQVPNDWFDAILLEDRDRVFAQLAQQQEGLPVNMEYRIQRPDGTIRWIWDRGFAIQDAQGNVDYFGGIAEDITDRKQTEIQLREMSTALGNAVEGISRLDEQGHYLFVNDAYARKVGYTPEEMVGMSWQRTVHPEDLETLIAAYHHMRNHGKVELEARGIRKDGSVFYKQLFMIAAYSEQQQFIGHYCFMKDISERKQLEAERQQAEQKIHDQAALLEIATDAIFVRDVTHQILYWNRGAEKVYGWQAAEVLGKKTTELLYSEVPAQLEVALKTTLEQGEWQGEFHQITKSEQPMIVQSRWTLVRDEVGQPKWILTVNTDITEKKQLESQFLRAQRLESIGTLASGIAHDLNNILTPILAVAQLLPMKFQDLDDRTQQLLDILEANSKRGADLVKQVLSFARGVEGRRTALQVGHLLIEIEQIAKRTFPKSIQIRTDIPKSQLWLVSADSTQLHQVMMNLCVNARDAMGEGGTLRITAENRHVDETYARMHPEAKAGPYVVITIADTGMGIQPEVLDRIFDPFFTTKAVGKGTGLGLSTAMGIVKSHNGFISVYSEVHQGTQFKVYLPAVEEAEIRLEPDCQLKPGQGELILVVDDEPYIQEIAKVTLEDHNYRVMIATNGFEAITLYAKHHAEISLVMMDLLMPAMDGLVAIRTLQKINPHVKVIATSGILSNEKIIELNAIGIQTCLPKPYTAHELFNALEQALSEETTISV